MKNHSLVLIFALFAFCILFAGGEPGCSNYTEADLAILQVNPTVYNYGWGEYVSVEVIVKNLSPSHSFKGEVNLQTFRDVAWDEEYLCGGLEEQSYNEELTLDPGQIKTLYTSYRLCRPGNYPVKVELTLFPSDVVLGNNVLEDVYQHVWDETVDLSFAPEDWILGYNLGVSQGCASVWFDMYNIGNAPVRLPANRTLASATLTFPDGSMSGIEFSGVEPTFLAPYPNYGYQDYINFGTFWYLGPEGEYTLSVFLNNESVVQETDRTNNTLEIPFGFYVPDLDIENYTWKVIADPNNPGYVIPVFTIWIQNIGRGNAYIPVGATFFEAQMHHPGGLTSYHYSDLEYYDISIESGERLPVYVELGSVPRDQLNNYSVDLKFNPYREVYERNTDNNQRWQQL
ncbi:MAG TPA: hypothetical protein VJA22_00435 [Patescibacteria group bacterium]|nr:hypothetical protein [Patescibacteria group bacterium]